MALAQGLAGGEAEMQALALALGVGGVERSALVDAEAQGEGAPEPEAPPVCEVGAVALGAPPLAVPAKVARGTLDKDQAGLCEGCCDLVSQAEAQGEGAGESEVASLSIEDGLSRVVGEPLPVAVADGAPLSPPEVLPLGEGVGEDEPQPVPLRLSEASGVRDAGAVGLLLAPRVRDAGADAEGVGCPVPL